MNIATLSNVSFEIDNKKILSNLDLEINKGDFLILLGGNGSGKSSFLKLLYRDYQSTEGEIQFLDKPIGHYSDSAFSKQVAVSTQNLAESLFNTMTVYENYLLVKKNDDRQVIKEYLCTFNPKLSSKLDTHVYQLSGGEKQALTLALRLLQSPALLLLDENTSALDPKTSSQMMAMTAEQIQQHQITCILITHDLDIALTYGNRLVILRDGKIDFQCGGVEKNTLTKSALLEKYY